MAFSTLAHKLKMSNRCVNTCFRNKRYFKIKLTSKYKPIICALKNYNLNSREKFKPGPGLNLGLPDL